MKRSHAVGIYVALLMAGILAASAAWAQVNAVDLGGLITDPQNAPVSGAKVTVKNLATNAARSAETGNEGRFLLVGLAPGRYELSVEKSGFARAVNPEVVLEIGRAPEVNIQLRIQAANQQVTVVGEAELVETQRTAVSETVGSREIDNLPINGRNYVNFTLINSQANRDSAPSIGAAPTSGLNFGGQRARSNEVSVDGADAVDNSVNGIRSTVSQEDVQEFQLIISNYMPEFGRASGGVINIVTKSGSNQFHGDVFGFLRDAALQARNPFSFNVNPATGAETPVKQAYTRAQYGTAFGGPIQKDKTFYFFSFEGTRRHETDFTDIGEQNFGLVPFNNAAVFPATLLLTQSQVTAVNSLLATGVPALQTLAGSYAVLAGSASSVALHGVDFGAVAFGQTGGLYNPGPGAQFPLPAACVPGAMVNGRACSAIGVVAPALPGSFVPLTSLIGNYPIVERTDLYAARLDHIWNANNQSFFRANVSPSFVTGIEVNAQNQSFGENAASRTSLQQYRDMSFVFQHNTTFSSNLLNEFRFQFSRRGLHYGFSDCTEVQCPTENPALAGGPGGSQTGVNITGYAFFGREPFSTVDRIERRFQWTDQLTYVMGKHTIKFGVDTNLIQVRTRAPQTFELDFGGLYNFGSLSASTFGFPSSVAGVNLPAITALQAYGLGLPGSLYQGTGKSNAPFDNTEFGTFIQDSWRFNPHITINYGLRYDIEFTPLFTPFGGATGLNGPAEKALNIVEGIPVYDNALQPRLGIAWDPWGDGKTVIRAGGGLFFDHPLLAIAFDATTADGARSSQILVPGGSASACGIFVPGTPTYTPICGPAADGPGNLNAGSIFQGTLNTSAPAGFPYPIGPYLPNQQRFVAVTNSSVFVNENYLSSSLAPFGGFPSPVLPFTFPVGANFAYGYATQANLTIEHDFGHSYKISIGYQYTKGTHLNRPRNINVGNAALMTQNNVNAVASGLVNSSNPEGIQVPTNAAAGSCTNTTYGGSLFMIAPGALALGFPAPNCAVAPVGYVGTPFVFNFFRPSGPNPSFATLYGGYGAELELAGLAGYPTGYTNAAGVPIQVPWSDVDQQESTGNSTYNGLTINIEKRFSQHFQFLMSYTYSHAIDDSTDLQSLLTPQDSNNPQLERGNSTFDQRHRFVFSGVAQSPYAMKDGGWKAFLADWTVAPIIEFSSGRPYTILTGTDYDLQFSSTTDRPSISPVPIAGVSVTSPYIPGVNFVPASVCPLGNLIATTPSGTAVSVTSTNPALGNGVQPNGCTGNLGRNTFVSPKFQSVDLRISRKFKVNERFSLEVLADMFNLANRFNAVDVNPLCDPVPAAVTGGFGRCAAGQPTAALDPRTFQFGLKAYF
jgi:Carboxypeptidase regulatory-like domain